MQNPTPVSKLFILEGNIGAGKSTFLKIINSKLHLSVIQEPANKWQEMSGTGNLLNLFYQDTKRWAYTFQTYAFINRVQTITEYQKNNKADIQVLERSVFCDRFCFAKNCYEMGFITDLEWQIYTETFAWMVENYTQRPSGFIYLRTSPEVCATRISKRNRSEEQSIKLSYLQLLHQKHEDWLIHKKEISRFISQTPVLVLDCDANFEVDLSVQSEHLKKVQDFINQVAIGIPHGTTNENCINL